VNHESGRCKVSRDEVRVKERRGGSSRPQALEVPLRHVGFVLWTEHSIKRN
jgi:hypothetical protein